MKFISTVTVLLAVFFMALPLQAQDTLQVSLNDFIQRGMQNSGQIDYQEQNISLAENKVDQAQAQRVLPKLDLSTQHGVVPGVRSNTNLKETAYYLDPNLENDWDNWAVFTRAEVNAVQPIFTWGAINNAINAAQSAAKAAREQFESQKADMQIRLYDLYQSYVLTLEVNRLLEEAKNEIEKIEKQIDESRESGDSEVDESDVFKFKIFKSEFEIRAAEVKENSKFIQSVWNYVLQAEEGQVFEPATRFLDPIQNPIEELDYYRISAVQARPEVKAIEAGVNAAEYGIEATQAQRYPSLFLGLTGKFAKTPNRPRQSNPFIINNSNFLSAGFGLSIRQNLNFWQITQDVDRSRIKHKQAKYLKEAAVDGIVLEINEKYKNASLSKVKVEKTDEALVTGKQWLRQEQLDYDFGIGEIKDLLDAMKKELELRVQLKQRIFDFNKDMAELYRASGLEITTLKMTN
ncbi:MAG: TolC family protein [Balneolaceae bacterium]|nr:TolC family protein [Balneolaceae bacterium]